MRYVVVCLIYGEALEFHEKVVAEICSEFNVKRQRLPAHFTIKAPFETENIAELDILTKNFVSLNNPTHIKINNFGYFRENVIYMDVVPSIDAVKSYDAYIDLLQTLPWLEWKKNDGKGRVFHCTLISKIPYGKFNLIWNYTSKLSCYYELKFDNISILKWDKDKWNLHKQYKFKNERP